MRTASLLTVNVNAKASCAPTLEQGAFFLRLGRPTLAADRFVIADSRIEADVTLRTSRTAARRFVSGFDDAGMMRRLEATVRDPASTEAPPLRKDLLPAATRGIEAAIKGDALLPAHKINWHFSSSCGTAPHLRYPYL